MWNPHSELAIRWDARERGRIDRAFASGAFPKDLPTVVHGGTRYTDLRGFPFHSEILVDLTRVDLSDCNMQYGGIGREIRISNCLFNGARLWTTLGYDVRQCDFSNAQMKGADLRGVFRRCKFPQANLVGVKNLAGVSRFVRCDFRGAKLRNAELRDTVFDHCLWEGATIGSGSFVGSRFLGERPSAQQFGQAILETDVDEGLAKEIEAEVAARLAKAKQGTRRR